MGGCECLVVAYCNQHLLVGQLQRWLRQINPISEFPLKVPIKRLGFVRKALLFASTPFHRHSIIPMSLNT